MSDVLRSRWMSVLVAILTMTLTRLGSAALPCGSVRVVLSGMTLTWAMMACIGLAAVTSNPWSS